MTDKEIEVIVKPIFTTMFNSNFSACEYGIECYKKGMEYQGIKELAIENDNLIKQVRKLEQQIEEMKCCENCKYNSYWGNELHCNYGLKEALKEDKLVECNKMDKWEIKENE